MIPYFTCAHVFPTAMLEMVAIDTPNLSDNILSCTFVFLSLLISLTSSSVTLLHVSNSPRFIKCGYFLIGFLSPDKVLPLNLQSVELSIADPKKKWFGLQQLGVSQ